MKKILIVLIVLVLFWLAPQFAANVRYPMNVSEPVEIQYTFTGGGVAESAVDSCYACSTFFVNLTGDTMIGDLTLNAALAASSGTFGYVDKLEASEPPTPPANTLRLFVVNQDGFSRYNYKDDLGVVRTLNDDEIIVNNTRGSTIAKHRLVYATGHSGGIPTVNLARADNISTMPAFCVTIESIANNALGRCMMSGLIQNVNTNSFNVGTIYVSDTTEGVPTNTPPLTPNLTQEMGTILVKSATVGEIQIIARALTGDEFGTINNFTVQGNLEVKGNTTSGNVFIPQYIFAHTNANISVTGADVWTNVTFDQEATAIMHGISHNGTGPTNMTFTVMEDGIYNIDYDFDVEDASAGASDIDVAGRLVLTNGTEVVGSVFEIGITRQGSETELSHNFLAACRTGDAFNFQFIASDADVKISTHGTYGDHPESATVMMVKIANLP
jgi:hypothetical protein